MKNFFSKEHKLFTLTETKVDNAFVAICRKAYSFLQSKKVLSVNEKKLADLLEQILQEQIMIMIKNHNSADKEELLFNNFSNFAKGYGNKILNLERDVAATYLQYSEISPEVAADIRKTIRKIDKIIGQHSVYFEAFCDKVYCKGR